MKSPLLMIPETCRDLYVGVGVDPMKNLNYCLQEAARFHHNLEWAIPSSIRNDKEAVEEIVKELKKAGFKVEKRRVTDEYYGKIIGVLSIGWWP